MTLISVRRKRKNKDYAGKVSDYDADLKKKNLKKDHGEHRSKYYL
jgi:hypothetical protein